MSLATNVFTNFLWRFSERGLSQVIQFCVTIVLARLLLPAEYGTIALVTAFISMLEVFVNCGLGSALVQKKDSDQIDFSTVFYANIVLCGIVYFALWFCAPLVSSYYEKDLTSLTRVLGIKLLIAGVNNVQQSYVSKNLIFKRFFYATLSGVITSAVFGLVLAYYGFGVWALVAQSLSNSAINTMVLWFTVKWRPILVFSFERFKKLFSFGYKLLLAGIVGSIFDNIRTLIIGKLYQPSDLAFYDKGNQFPWLLANNVNMSIDGVLYPAMVKVQDDLLSLKMMVRRAIRVNTYVVAPIMVWLACAATPLITVLLTEKWLEIVPFMQIFCVCYIFYPIHTANLNAIKSLGRSDLFFILEIIKKVIGLIAILLTMRFGPLAMAWGALVVSFLSQVVNSWPNRKLLNYSYLEQLKDIFPNLIISSLMGFAIYCMNFLPISPLLLLIAQSIIGVITYLVLSYIFHNDSMFYLIEICKDVIKGIKK